MFSMADNLELRRRMLPLRPGDERYCQYPHYQPISNRRIGPTLEDSPSRYKARGMYLKLVLFQNDKQISLIFQRHTHLP